MLDMSWGEVMLIGGVALVVIGPKDLPKALRTLGQITTKVRRMAAEFQHQFNEAIREAELEEVRREVEGVKRKAESFKPSFNPVDTIRNELKSAVEGKDAAKGPVAQEPAGQGASDPLAGAAPAAMALATEESTERLTTGGSYDVPRPTEPAPTGPDIPPAEAAEAGSTDSGGVLPKPVLVRPAVVEPAKTDPAGGNA